MKPVPRILLGAPGSGSGKTTVTMALLSALKMRGTDAASFKVGPDYIDPMFHERILKLPCRNLDSFLLGKERCRSLLAKNGREFQVLEGVMGFYDGIGTGTRTSTYEMGKFTETPGVLVMSVKGAAVTAAAVAKGIANFRKDSGIKGIILNGVRKMMYPYYKEIMETHTDLKVYGYLPMMEDCSIGSRHLGLITAAEITELEDIVNKLGETALETLDIDGLMELGSTAPPLETYETREEPKEEVILAVAGDKAFSFYYEDAMEYLESLGVKRVYFSPLEDEPVPKEAHGVYLGGGYPENYMDRLSKSENFFRSIRRSFQNKMPLIAECGGFMVLQEFFQGEKKYPLAGLFPGSCRMTDRLNHFGYLELTAKKDGLLLDRGETIRAHEFHYSKSDCPGEDFSGKKPESTRGWETGYSGEHYYVGYPHLHLFGAPESARRFVAAMKKYKEDLWQRL